MTKLIEDGDRLIFVTDEEETKKILSEMASKRIDKMPLKPIDNMKIIDYADLDISDLMTEFSKLSSERNSSFRIEKVKGIKKGIYNALEKLDKLDQSVDAKLIKLNDDFVPFANKSFKKILESSDIFDIIANESEESQKAIYHKLIEDMKERCM